MSNLITSLPLRALKFVFPQSKTYTRSSLLDGLRGFAIVLMVIFHFFYDLTLFELAVIPIYSSFEWIAFRYTIVTLFLGTVGASLYLHTKRGINWSSYWRRLSLLVAAAAIITLTTFITMRDEYVVFGILHLIAATSILGLLFTRFFWLNLIIGIAVLWLGFNYGHPVFNQEWLLWIGLRTEATGDADYTPIFPWFGAALIGMFIARLLGDKLFHPLPSSLSFLALWGRYSLIIYLVHQPILWGLIAIYKQIIS